MARSSSADCSIWSIWVPIRFNLAGGTLSAGQINDGTNGTVLNYTSGVIDPGGILAVGTTDFTAGDLTLPGAGTLQFDLSAAGVAGTAFDLLDVFGDIDLALGDLSVTLLGGFETGCTGFRLRLLRQARSLARSTTPPRPIRCPMLASSS